jgi:hypothetical protein
MFAIKHRMDFFLGGLAIGLAVGFSRYLGRYVLFPLFPNILDAAVMVLIGAYLIKNSIR